MEEHAHDKGAGTDRWTRCHEALLAATALSNDVARAGLKARRQKLCSPQQMQGQVLSGKAEGAVGRISSGPRGGYRIDFRAVASHWLQHDVKVAADSFQ